ncbi:alpha-amylase family protein [Paenibacillus mendelii]|uniref:Beta-galactosidase n=1 Tax=Paenibacillus mendelii TaxID=206163 RepID=A0ABV6JK25_9BACL|nr:alpha-amylase family protein [Paenibacillus mendelii]MCQ6559207.1 beta-galactosidase [Paenibacillus mendelii]
MSRPIIIFSDPAFPGGNHDKSNLTAAQGLAGIGTVVDAASLAESLQAVQGEGAGGCFINLHAPYFPKAAWEAILAFLRAGGGLVSIGGAPFKRPVRMEDGQWLVEAEQTAYHQQLNIHETLPVDGKRVETLAALAEIPLFSGYESLFEAGADTWNLVPHVTKTSDLPHQMGSAGPMDARLYPVLKGVTGEGREVAAPAVLWENTNGAFGGGRWLLVNTPLTSAFWAGSGAEALSQWASYCGRGVTELWVKPNYASFEPGERPMLTLQTQSLARSTKAVTTSWTFSLALTKEGDSSPCWTHPFTTEVSGKLDIKRISVPVEVESGYYRLVCRAESEDGEMRILRQGFWGVDRQMLREGEPVSCGRDYFEKDGRPLPVVGMTYMTSDVARKFLFLPNADVWDRDMAAMRKAGINWIRTGIWTAYRNVMQVDGHASEEALRAIDAFIMTAKKNDLQLTFTFFSFTPETWEGTNPYLDPRSVEAQKRFVRSIVSRHRDTKNVDWDLINEPSMFDPEKIFSDGPRSCRDPFEQTAYVEWLEKRHGSIALLQERWNMTPEQLPSFNAVKVPDSGEVNFDVQDMHSGKKGTRWLDYCLFSMEMHNRWAKQLYEAIKEECPDHMVTVGQDEGLGAQRPSPLFYGEAVDYTTVHSWWLNDQLVWDGVFAKTLDKPNLVQETGIMYVETPEGRAKRSEAELRNILERKYAYAFATGGAGAVQWIWNTNFYMDNANESHIGALRADGTEKPEADVSYDFGQFMEEIRDLFRERKLEETVIIFPYSNDFSNRKLAFDATTRSVRVWAYDLNMPIRGISEYDLGVLEREPAKLIVLPSAHNVDDAAFDALIEHVKKSGATLLVTGPIGIDAYWRPTERLEQELGAGMLSNVLREETLVLGDRQWPVSYGSRRIAQLFKEVRGGEANRMGDALVEVELGRGRLLWSPLPVELNDRTEPVAALYRHAAAAAGVNEPLEWLQGGDLPGVYGRKLAFKDGSLFVFVSEYAFDADIEVKDAESGATYSFLLERERSVLFATDAQGRLKSVYRPHEVRVNVK